MVSLLVQHGSGFFYLNTVAAFVKSRTGRWRRGRSIQVKTYEKQIKNKSYNKNIYENITKIKNVKFTQWT